MQVGDIIRVSGWPGTSGRRFRVIELVENPNSPYPKQVYCQSLNEHQFHAFPIENVIVDRKATKRYQTSNDS